MSASRSSYLLKAVADSRGRVPLDSSATARRYQEHAMTRQAFIYPIPLWMVATGGNVFVIEGVGTKCLPLFTDQDLMERFTETVPLADYEAEELPTIRSLVNLLTHSQRTGVTHVVFDHSGRIWGFPPDSSFYVPVADLREHAENRLSADGDDRPAAG